MKKFFLAFLLLIASAAAGAQTNCAVNPGACQVAPVPSDCPSGKHWTTMGSGIAHCVGNDPACNGTVTHDSLGNPTGCVPPTPHPVSTSYYYNDFGCGPGETGRDYERYPITTWSDGTTTSGDWEVITYTCQGGGSTPPPSSSCTNGATNYPYCNNQSVTSCTNGANDWPNCTPPDTSSSTPTSPGGSCANGATNYPTCTPPPAPTCANGATDYPTCTPYTPPPPPPPPTCPNGASNYPTCTFAAPAPQVCPYNNTSKLSCTASGSPGSSGLHQETFYRDNGLGNGGCTTSTTVIGTCGYNPSYWFNDY